MEAREGLFNPVVLWAKFGAGMEEVACFYAKSRPMMAQCSCTSLLGCLLNLDHKFLHIF